MECISNRLSEVSFALWTILLMKEKAPSGEKDRSPVSWMRTAHPSQKKSCHEMSSEKMRLVVTFIIICVLFRFWIFVILGNNFDKLIEMRVRKGIYLMMSSSNNSVSFTSDQTFSLSGL